MDLKPFPKKNEAPAATRIQERNTERPRFIRIMKGVVLWPRTYKGFSLLEVIIGVAILSTGIVVILQALIFSARITGVSGATVRAAFLAEDKWQEADFKVKKGIIKEPATEKGELGDFKWSYEVAKIEDNDGLYELKVDIDWQKAGRDEKMELNTWLLKG